MPYFELMSRSLRKFHSEEELPIKLIGPDELRGMEDPMKFYRMTPFVAKDLLKEYELVLKLDADIIITGDLNHIINDTSYDVGVTLNWNRYDAKNYPPVSVWDINPPAYFNCGVVAMRSKEFVDKWWDLCVGPHFNSYQYKEQDFLNILAYYFDWTVKNLDSFDTWNNLLWKGMGTKLVMRGNDIVCPAQPDGFPNKDMTIKVMHFAGGEGSTMKMKYKSLVSEEVGAYIDTLVKP